MAAALPLAGILAPAHPRPRPAFALTPLADIMFQLLIFFMLSTSLAPYALLPLGQRATAPEGAGPAPESAAPAATGSPAIWHLGRGQIRSGRVWIDLADLPAALAALPAAGVTEVLLFVTDTANTQDLATLLERVQAQGALRLRLIAR